MSNSNPDPIHKCRTVCGEADVRQSELVELGKLMVAAGLRPSADPSLDEHCPSCRAVIQEKRYRFVRQMERAMRIAAKELRGEKHPPA